MPDLYEFGITGSIGPIIAACLPEFSTVTESQWTVLTGTVHGPDDLHRVPDLLSTHGTAALDIRIAYRHNKTAAPTSGPAREY